jgi:subtilisin family serine protease
MRYVIDFIDSMSQEEVDQYLHNDNITKIRQYSNFGHVYLVEADTKPATNEQVLYVLTDDDHPLTLLGLDVTITDSIETTTFEIEDTKNWWKVASINNLDFDEQIHTHTIRGFNSTVYILDSGIEANHPEFENANVTLLHSFTEDFTDTRGHGTGLASLISGKTCGLTGASLKIVKIFDKNQPTLQSDLLHALDAVLTDYISNGRKASVANLSWGIPKNDYINAKIQVLLDQGIFVVAASGNSGIPIGDVTPASISDVLTIGAYNQNLTPCDFSNYTGETIVSLTQNVVNTGALDGWAPGEQIWVAGLNGTYGFVAGTSAAAAITSGAIAYNFYKFTSNENDSGIFNNYYNAASFLQKRKLPEDWSGPDQNPTPYSVLGISKPNMLDFSDPKYSSSTNKSVSYMSGAQELFPMTRINATGGETYYKSVISRVATARAVTSQDIPEFITVDERGVITVVAPDITDLYLHIDPIEFDLYQRDGSMGTLVVNITIFRSDINRNNAESLIPADDPALNFILFGGSCVACNPACTGNACETFSKGVCGCPG